MNHAPSSTRHRPARRVGLALVAALATAVSLLVPASVSEAAPAIRVLQLNMCGADCAEASSARIEETVNLVLARKPAAVSLNEACRADVTTIASRLRAGGRAMTVTYHATIPGGRGKCASSDYGTAVLTSTAPATVRTTVYSSQAGAVERRAALCVQVTSTRPVWICSTHLEPGRLRESTRLSQAAQLAATLRGLAGPAILAGDLNEVPAGDTLDTIYTSAHGGGASGLFVGDGSPCRCGTPTRDAAKIDYVLATGATLRPAGSTVTDVATSDHSLLDATFTWR